jgi:hypothetical protein
VKGSTAQIILKTLKGKRFEGLLAQIATVPKGDLLVEMCKYMHNADEVSEADMRARFKLTAGQYYHWIEVIGGYLVSHLGANNDDIHLEQTFQLARELVFEVQVDAAADVMRAGIKAAAQMEQFDLVLRYWELVEMIHIPPKIEGMEEFTARRLRANLNAYSDLCADLMNIAKELNATTRRQAISLLLDSELLSDTTKALSQRAIYYYWRVKAGCHAHLREYGEAILSQEALLAHLEAFPWVCVDIEFNIAKNTANLAMMLRLDKQNKRFDEVRKRI